MSARRRLIACAALAALAGSRAGLAAQCSASVQGVAFGTYDTLANQSVDSAGSVIVTCDVQAAFSIALSPGSGTTLARQMQGPGAPMHYNLYTDPLRSTVWGDGTSGTALVSGNATSASFTVYGRIAAGQRLPAGSYTDTITVTLSF